MEYKLQPVTTKPRLIIHGGAGNIQPSKLTPEKYAQYREALLTIVRFQEQTYRPLR
jgi:L-asparaginase